MQTFAEALRTQRWDDHRYYHHSRINQALHLFSAMCFLVAYVLLFTDPAAAALVGWGLAMVSRQAGHFFFEPQGYDEMNQATHEHKEHIKIGYNLRRKVILHVVWAASPIFLLWDSTLFGLFAAHTSTAELIRHVGQLWLIIGFGALIVRAVHLFFIKDLKTGLVWITKILTDPFHDIALYHKAPLYLLRGELIEPNGEKQRA